MAVTSVPQGHEEGLMGPRALDGRLGSRDRIAAFAKATEVYAESLEDPDLANVYWGKSLGLWQAVAILGDDAGLAGTAASQAAVDTEVVVGG
jgi:hypothetical protein